MYIEKPYWCIFSNQSNSLILHLQKSYRREKKKQSLNSRKISRFDGWNIWREN